MSWSELRLEVRAEVRDEGLPHNPEVLVIV